VGTKRFLPLKPVQRSSGSVLRISPLHATYRATAVGGILTAEHIKTRGQIMKKFMLALALQLLTLSFSANAFAITPEDFFDGKRLLPHITNVLKGLGFDNRYQIGEEWGKKPVTEEDLASNTYFRRMALATAKIRGGGTGFFIGKYNGHYIMATNHHVCPSSYECDNDGAVEFTLLGYTTRVEEFYGTWPEIDLSLFSIEVTDEQMAAKLREVTSPFSFEEDIKHTQELVTIGYGSGNNPRQRLVANRDSDCIVFSANGEYRLMADPDDLNPGPYKAWSFANGCDVSHGDSGSAMMDRNTGHVVGIIWTGRIPKDPKVRSADYLQNLLRNPNEDVWNQLSYSVPAVRMKTFLQALLAADGIQRKHYNTVSAVVNSQVDSQ
jgi:Trypsin-like peptidase domain